MCGRFSVHLTDLGRISDDIEPLQSDIRHWKPRYNVAPTQLAPIVVTHCDVPTLSLMSWGFVTHFRRDVAGPRPINARSETIGKSRLFGDAFRSQRCVVPTTGYFEWRKKPTPRHGITQPYWIRRQRGDVLYLAGIWSKWQPPSGDPWFTFAILTRRAVGAPSELHHRMPLELRTRDLARWLSPEPLPADLFRELTVHVRADDYLVIEPANPAMNRATFDDPSALHAPSGPFQLGLFR